VGQPPSAWPRQKKGAAQEAVISLNARIRFFSVFWKTKQKERGSRPALSVD
jgi:hypothetical protein